MTCPTPPLDHHDALRLGLMDAGRGVRSAAEEPSLFHAARDELVGFCLNELLPHLEEDEGWLREARACATGGLLADAMLTESRAMTGAVHELLGAETPCEVVATTRVLHALLAAHAHHEALLARAGGHAVVPGDRSTP